MAFQLIDDALDYSSSNKIMGKNIGDDLKEGKITLPLILAYGRSNQKEKKFWQKSIKKNNHKNNNFEEALQIINKYNCIQDTITRAKHFNDVAIDSLDVFKDDVYKEVLIGLAKGSIKRLG